MSKSVAEAAADSAAETSKDVQENGDCTKSSEMVGHPSGDSVEKANQVLEEPRIDCSAAVEKKSSTEPTQGSKSSESSGPNVRSGSDMDVDSNGGAVHSSGVLEEVSNGNDHNEQKDTDAEVNGRTKSGNGVEKVLSSPGDKEKTSTDGGDACVGGKVIDLCSSREASEQNSLEIDGSPNHHAKSSNGGHPQADVPIVPGIDGGSSGQCLKSGWLCFVCLWTKGRRAFNNPPCCQNVCDQCTLALCRKGVNLHKNHSNCSAEGGQPLDSPFYESLREVLGSDIVKNKDENGGGRISSNPLPPPQTSIFPPPGLSDSVQAAGPSNPAAEAQHETSPAPALGVLSTIPIHYGQQAGPAGSSNAPPVLITPQHACSTNPGQRGGECELPQRCDWTPDSPACANTFSVGPYIISNMNVNISSQARHLNRARELALGGHIPPRNVSCQFSAGLWTVGTPGGSQGWLNTTPPPPHVEDPCTSSCVTGYPVATVMQGRLRNLRNVPSRIDPQGFAIGSPVSRPFEGWQLIPKFEPMARLHGGSVMASILDPRQESNTEEGGFALTSYGLMDFAIEPPLPSLELKRIARDKCGRMRQRKSSGIQLETLEIAKSVGRDHLVKMARARSRCKKLKTRPTGKERKQQSSASLQDMQTRIVSSDTCLWCKRELTSSDIITPSMRSNGIWMCNECRETKAQADETSTMPFPFSRREIRSIEKPRRSSKEAAQHRKSPQQMSRNPNAGIDDQNHGVIDLVSEEEAEPSLRNEKVVSMDDPVCVGPPEYRTKMIRFPEQGIGYPCDGNPQAASSEEGRFEKLMPLLMAVEAMAEERKKASELDIRVNDYILGRRRRRPAWELCLDNLFKDGFVPQRPRSERNAGRIGWVNQAPVSRRGGKGRPRTTQSRGRGRSSARRSHTLPGRRQSPGKDTLVPQGGAQNVEDDGADLACHERGFSPSSSDAASQENGRVKDIGGPSNRRQTASTRVGRRGRKAMSTRFRRVSTLQQKCKHCGCTLGRSEIQMGQERASYKNLCERCADTFGSFDRGDSEETVSESEAELGFEGNGTYIWQPSGYSERRDAGMDSTPSPGIVSAAFLGKSGRLYGRFSMQGTPGGGRKTRGQKRQAWYLDKARMDGLAQGSQWESRREPRNEYCTKLRHRDSIRPPAMDGPSVELADVRGGNRTGAGVRSGACNDGMETGVHAPSDSIQSVSVDSEAVSDGSWSSMNKFCEERLVKGVEHECLFPSQESKAWQVARKKLRKWPDKMIQAKVHRYGIRNFTERLVKSSYICAEDL